MDLIEKQKHREEIKKRFLSFLFSVGLKQKTNGLPDNITGFEREIGVSSKSISGIYTGKIFPSFETLFAINKHYPYISTEWLLFGTGAMTKSGILEASKIFNEPEAAYTSKNASEIERLRAEADKWKDKYIACLEGKL